MKKFTYIIILFIILPLGLSAQNNYVVHLVSVRGYNNNCDGTGSGNEEGRFDFRVSDNVDNYAAKQQMQGCIYCDGNFNSAGGKTCSDGWIVASSFNTAATSVRTETRGHEDDVLVGSNCGYPDDCNSDWATHQTLTLSTLSEGTWSSNYVVQRDSRYEYTYRVIWWRTIVDNQWQAHVFDGNSFAGGNTVRGVYTQTSLSFDTETRWGSASGAPSQANSTGGAGYQGIGVGADNHHTLYIRRGFPCGSYQLSLTKHDDGTIIYLDNSPILSHDPNCCDAHTNFWSGILNSSSTIEVWTREGSGGSNTGFTMTQTDAWTATAGTAQTVCAGANVALSGGTSGTTPSPCVFRSSNNTSGAIPDNNTTGVSRSISVSGTSANANAVRSVWFDITHTYDGDLEIYLIAPNNTSYLICNRRGGSGDNFSNTILMPGFGALSAGAAPFMNVYAPDVAFSTITGVADGTWQLKVVDKVSGDAGTLNRWGVEIPYTCSPTYAWSGPNSFSSTSQNSSISNIPIANSGTYTVTATSAQGGCTQTANVAITVVSDPTISTQPTSPAAICTGGATSNITIAATGGTPSLNYQWQYNNGGSWGNVVNGTPTGATYTGGTSTTFSVVGISSANTYQYRCIVSATGSGCDAVPSNTINVVVVAQPVAQTITGSPAAGSSVCAGTNISATFSGGSGGVVGATTNIYEFSTNAGSTWATYSAGANISTTGLSGTNIVRIRTRRTSTGTGCNASSYNTAMWSVVANPSGGNIATVFTCPSVAVNVSVSGVSNATQYIWSLPVGLSGVSTSNTISVTGATSGSYTVTVTPQNVGGTTCNGIAIVGTVTIFGTTISVAAPSGATPLTQCDGGNPDAISVASPTGGNGIYTYQWQQSVGCTGTWINAVAESGGSTGLSFDPPVLTLPTTAICYRLRVTDGCGSIGFSALKTYNIVADPAAPSATKSPNVATACEGQSLTLTGVAQGSGGTGTCNIEYATSTNGGISYSAWSTTLPVITATGTDNRIKIRTNCNALGCDVSSEITYTWAVIPALSLTPSGTNVSCFGGSNGTASVTVTAGGTGTYTYSWYTGGSGNSISGLSANIYNVLVTSGVCSATTSYIVTQPAVLSASLSNVVHDLCQLGLGAVKITVTGGTPPYTISKNPINTGTFSPSNTINTSGGQTNVINISGGSTLNIIITDLKGCVFP